jgi:hypothetical protein
MKRVHLIFSCFAITASSQVFAQPSGEAGATWRSGRAKQSRALPSCSCSTVKGVAAEFAHNGLDGWHAIHVRALAAAESRCPFLGSRAARSMVAMPFADFRKIQSGAKDLNAFSG